MTSPDSSDSAPNDASRIVEIKLDETSIGRNTPEVDHEREVAIFDILEGNCFALEDGPAGPYRLNLAIVEKRLVFEVLREDGLQSRHSFCPFRHFRS